MLGKPEVESAQNIVERHATRQVVDLENRVNMIRLLNAVHEVVSLWAGKNRGNIWSRHACMYCFSTNTAEVDVYLSPGDSMKSLLSLFEAIQLPDLEFVNSSIYPMYVVHSVKYSDCFLEFNVYLEKSETCKMVPIYETKRVQVGTKVVCND